MECIETIKGRRSVRRFKAQSVGKEMIEELLDAARMAPSAGNLQARDFIVISNKITKQKLKEAALGQSFIEQAPLVIVAVANVERSSRVYKTRGSFMQSRMPRQAWRISCFRHVRWDLRRAGWARSMRTRSASFSESPIRQNR